MKTKILAFIAAATLTAAAHAETQPGWGSKQTTRTITGILGGATFGGVVGHQHGKQKEGIIIGSVLGGIIGNMSGKGSDHRAAQKSQQASMSARERYFARRQAEQTTHFNNLRTQDDKRFYDHPVGNTTCRPVASGGSLQNDPEIVAARQRAEQLELELQRQQQIRQREIEKQRLLNEYAAREASANQALGEFYNP